MSKRDNNQQSMLVHFTTVHMLQGYLHYILKPPPLPFEIGVLMTAPSTLPVAGFVATGALSAIRELDSKPT